jgi:hypothetical protein
MRKSFVTVVLSAAFLLGGAGSAFADAPPPTEGGNGAGSSGQCTGNPDDRPQSCHDQGGPGNQP